MQLLQEFFCQQKLLPDIFIIATEFNSDISGLTMRISGKYDQSEKKMIIFNDGAHNLTTRFCQSQPFKVMSDIFLLFCFLNPKRMFDTSLQKVFLFVIYPNFKISKS